MDVNAMCVCFTGPPFVLAVLLMLCGADSSSSSYSRQLHA